MVSQLLNGALRASSMSRVYSSCAVPRLVSRQRRPHLTSASLFHTTTPSRFAQPEQKVNQEPKSRTPQDVAVLGGGLTGLTTAYYLNHFNPHAKITIYEASGRLGGWIDTEKIRVATKNGESALITLERGARVVTPKNSLTNFDDHVFYDLIQRLGLYGEHEGDVSCISSTLKEDPALSNRYIYYPDHLVAMPKGGLSLLKAALKEPVFEGIVPAAWHAYRALWRAKVKGLQNVPDFSKQFAISDIEDMSMGAFLEHLLGGRAMVDNLASALFHGIWGGDIWKLSAISSMQQPYIQMRMYGLNRVPLKLHDECLKWDIKSRNSAVRRMINQFSQSAYIGFEDGFGSLTKALVRALQSSPNVTIRTSAPISSIRYDRQPGKAVVTLPTEKKSHDKVISSLYSGTLAQLAGDALPSLSTSEAVTIQIVNLWYADPNLTARHPGFGYLTPQSVPFEQNPHCALGVIFDSDFDSAAGKQESVSAPGTKLTVMLGGHYWAHLPPENWPDDKEATRMAIETVERQLGIPTDEPVFTSTKVCRQCIPQHLVGHRTRMAQAHSELSDAFHGTLSVVGGSYTSPGVMPSLRAARDMALQVAGEKYLVPEGFTGAGFSPDIGIGETGLGRFWGDNEKFVLPTKQELVAGQFQTSSPPT